MTVAEVNAIAGQEVSSLGARDRLGTHYLRRGGADLWFDFKDGALRAVLLSKVVALKRVTLSPRRDLCTGTTSFLIRLLLPTSLEGASVFVDGKLLTVTDRLQIDIELPAGRHEIRLKRNGFEATRQLNIDQNGPGDIELRFDLPPEPRATDSGTTS